MTQKNPKSPNLERLIEDEWDIICDLKNTMTKPELSMDEKLRAANAYAYHASVLSKLLAQKGADAHLDETTLGDFIKGVEPRVARFVLVKFRCRMRKPSSKK